MTTYNLLFSTLMIIYHILIVWGLYLKIKELFLLFGTKEKEVQYKQNLIKNTKEEYKNNDLAITLNSIPKTKEIND